MLMPVKEIRRSQNAARPEIDQREAREVGEKAVQFAMWGGGEGSVTLRRSGAYGVDYELAPLAAIAGKTRLMDDSFISADATDVTDAFSAYLRPLLGAGMPDAGRLRAPSVAKAVGG